MEGVIMSKTHYLLSGEGGLHLIILPGGEKQERMISNFRPWEWDHFARFVDGVAQELTNRRMGHSVKVTLPRAPRIANAFDCELSVPSEARYRFHVPITGPVERFICEKGVYDPGRMVKLLKFLARANTIPIQASVDPDVAISHGK